MDTMNGGSGTPPEQTDAETMNKNIWKNIVIVGASFAGHTLANELAPRLPKTYRILLVERTPFAVHLPALVRAVIVPNSHRTNLTAPLSQDTVFPANSHHRLLCPKSVVELREQSVVLDTGFEGSTEVPFARCILATGSEQAPPMRPAPGTTLGAYHALLGGIQADVAAAKSVLVVGGGAAGVEIAGEITHHYPDKQVTLVHSRARLLVTGNSEATNEEGYSYRPPPESLSATLQAQLEAHGARIVLSDRLVFPSKTPGTAVSPARGDTARTAESATEHPTWTGNIGPLGRLHSVPLQSGATVTADYILLAVGNTPASSLVAGAAGAAGALTGTGHVAVTPEFRVRGLAKGYYALGDVCSTEGRKAASQAIDEATKLARIVAGHVADAEAGREETPRPRKPPAVGGILIPLGDAGAGAGFYDLSWAGVWAAPQWMVRWFAKCYFADRAFFPRFRGPTRVTGKETE